ncbi:unnamed protein product [Acanthoscelides obtectus]|uniref:Uncharacterized protein n=1 Tax=Acanthoscelides obtectus TaxID=200917 RepID=A0A9P0JSR5_ACAOB|nr:unnamed protein product [Acanthoscelides obtectus]CAK1642965.1 hypothetical protein AOBTE_LOCUS13323 [Acanthoscelides obtectus]
MASPVGRLYSAASAGNMDNAIQRKGINSGILSRKPLLDRPVNSKSPSVTGPMNKPASIGKQNISKLSFPSMTKQHSQVHLKEDEEDLNAEQFNFSFEEVEGNYRIEETMIPTTVFLTTVIFSKNIEVFFLMFLA